MSSNVIRLIRKFRLIFSINEEEKTVLDIGCGYGFDVKRLIKGAGKRLREAGVIFQGGADALGIDAAVEMINVGLKEYPELEGKLRVGNFLNLSSFDNEQFDVIFSRYTMHYKEGMLDPVYEQVHRILKPNGILLYLAAHPLLGMVATDMTYTNHGTATFSIYDGQFRVTEPKHTFGDYITEYFLRNFDLEVFEEQKKKRNENNLQVPDYFIVKARKRA